MIKERFVIKLDDGGYFSKDVSWKGVPLEQATRMTRADAYQQSNYLTQPRIRIYSEVEELTEEELIAE